MKFPTSPTFQAKEFIKFLLDLTISTLRGMTFERFVFISELHSIVYVDVFTACRRLSLAIVVWLLASQ